MKIYKNQFTRNILKSSLIKFLSVVSVVFLCSMNNTSIFAQRTSVNVRIELPGWAPHYDNENLVQYYYLPDIECFYDVANREYIYMEDGRWMFGAALPPVYSYYDLNSAFVVVLNQKVYEPWNHFHYYVAHYPRYYYRSVYRANYADRDHPMRGFNENNKIVVYNRGDVRREVRDNRNYPERRVEATHPARDVEYRGNEIGRPVKVKRDMMKPKEGRRR